MDRGTGVQNDGNKIIKLEWGHLQPAGVGGQGEKLGRRNEVTSTVIKGPGEGGH